MSRRKAGLIGLLAALCLSALPARAEVFPNVLFPPPGAFVNDTVVVTFDFNFTGGDTPGIINDTRFVVTQTILDVTNPNFPSSGVVTSGPLFTHAWNTRQVPDGVWHPNIAALNATANYDADTDPPGVRIDNHGPEIEHVEVIGPEGRNVYIPGDTLVIRARIHSEGAPTDTFGVFLQVFGLTIRMGDTGTSGDQTASDSTFTAQVVVPATAATVDTTFSITARDTAPLFFVNNTDTWNGSFHLDNDTPVIAFLTTTDPDTIYANGQTMIVRAFVTEGVSAVGRAGLVLSADFFRIDTKYNTGSEIVSDDGAGTYTIRYTIAVDNANSQNFDSAVFVTARDTLGHSVTATWLATLDNGSPRVRTNLPDTFVLSDTGDRGREMTINNNDLLTVVAEDSLAVRAVEFFVDVTGPNGNGTPMAPAAGFFDTTVEVAVAAFVVDTFAEGIHTIYTHAQDTAGNWGSFRTDTFLLDRRPPSLTQVVITYPSGQTRAKPGDSITLSVQITDPTPGAGLDTRQIYILAGGITTDSRIFLNDTGVAGDLVAGDGIYTAQIRDTANLLADTTITIVALDLVSNTATLAVTVKLQDTGLGITVRSLDPDTIYSNGQTVLLLVSDTGLPPGDTQLIVTADFFLPDNSYVTGGEVVANNGDSTYTVRYTIGLGNSRPDSNATAVRFVATDVAGNTAVATFLIALDNSGPIVRLNTPDTILLADTGDRGRDLRINNNDLLTAVAEDSFAVKNVEYFLDAPAGNGTGFRMAPAAGVYDTAVEVAIDSLVVGPLADGIHTIFTHAQDTAGTWGPFRTDTFLLDRVVPSISNVVITYPSGQTRAKNGDSVYLSASITDLVAGLDTQQIYVDASNVGPDSRAFMNDTGVAGDAVAGDGIYTVAFRVLVGGGATAVDTQIQVVALDLVPNTGTLTVSVRLQDTALTLTAVSLDADTIYANGQTVLLRVTETTSGDTRLTVAADFYLPDSSYVAGSENVANNANGTYTVRYEIGVSNTRTDSNLSAVRFTATDISGNTATAVFFIHIDNTPPVVRIDTPLEASTVRGIITETYTVADSSGLILRTELFVDGNSDTFDLLAPFDSFVIDTRRFGDGPHTLTMKATDTAGNSAFSAVRNIFIDNFAPQSIQIVRPDTGEILHDTVIIEALVSDVVSVRFVRFFIDGAIIDTDQIAPWLGTWNTRAFADGFHRIHVTAEDTAGNVVASDTIGVIVDNTAPFFVDLFQPSDSTSINETTRLRARASDTIGLDRIEYWRVDPAGDTRRIGVVELSGETDIVIDYTWDIRSETPGIHRLFVVAYDRATHASTSPLHPILIDFTAPGLDTVIVLNESRIPWQFFSPGDTVILVIRTGEGGDSLTADFSPIDSEYRTGNELPFFDLGGGNYEIRYRIRNNTTRPEATYAVPVTATDSAFNSVTLFAVMSLRFRGISVPSPNPFILGDASTENGKPFVAGDLTSGIIFRPLEPGASLEIFDVRGRQIRVLGSGGNRYIQWDARNSSSLNVASGYYIFVVRNPSGFVTTGKVAIIR